MSTCLHTSPVAADDEAFALTLGEAPLSATAVSLSGSDPKTQAICGATTRSLLIGMPMANCLQPSPVTASKPASVQVLSVAPHAITAPPSGSDPATQAIVARVGRAWFKSQWRAYAATFIAPDGRVIDNANGNVSHSEGQGYGLLLASIAEDPESFDLIWRWTEHHLRTRPDHLLSWEWDPQKNAVADPNNATDGDILVAWALAEGARKFGRIDYFAAAKTLAQAIGAKTLRTGGDGPILLPAATGFDIKDQSDGPIINLSYWIFPAFPTLKDLAPEYDWDAVHENGLKLLAASRFGPLNLPADWQSVAGASMAPARNFPAQFGYNAIRIPLYLAWDGGETSLTALRRFAALWNDKLGIDPAVIDVKTGSASHDLDGAGYRLVAALTRCVTNAQPIDADITKARDPLYYPESLRLLSLAVIQERFPQCL